MTSKQGGRRTPLRKGVRDEQSENRRHLLWGVVGVGVTGALLLTAGAVYAVPLGKKTYTAHFGTSGGLASGDEIRVAGIGVGSVRTVALAGDHVDVTFGIDRDVFVGDTSSVSVQLLTPIGGHYVKLDPTGDRPLDDAPIPKERTKTPFDLSATLEQATPLIRDVDGATLRATVAEVDKALTVQPESTRRVVDNLTQLTDLIAQRSEQLERGLAVSDEYTAALSSDELMLDELVRQLGTLTKGFGDKRTSVVSAFDLLKRLFELFHRPLIAYADGVEPSVVQLEEIVQKAFAQFGNFDSALTQIKTASDQISTLVANGNQDGPVIDQSQSVVRGATVCVPLPGKAC
ncbi:MlaD family protein [Rhodococcus sp. NPDC078407]|uniref:MlaD family protein n=1 Tax=Rhodococcus sp. NPDC078407 TaxID=3364509 RepID=UPI0037C52E80